MWGGGLPIEVATGIGKLYRLHIAHKEKTADTRAKRGGRGEEAGRGVGVQGRVEVERGWRVKRGRRGVEGGGGVLHFQVRHSLLDCHLSSLGVPISTALHTLLLVQQQLHFLTQGNVLVSDILSFLLRLC